MNKKLILLVALLSGISLVAMDHLQERPREASHDEKEARVKIRLTDAHNSETTHEVEIPVRLAKLIGALNELVEDPRLLPVWTLPNVTLVQWLLIEPLLERVYGITHDASQAGPLRQEIVTEFRKLDAISLIGVVYALEYLHIPILLESACEVLKKSALDKISWEELEEVPWHIRNQIIMYKLLMLLGPLPVKELALCTGHGHWVTSVRIMKNGKIVSGSADGTVRIWDMQGNQLGACWGHERYVTSVCITKEGKIVSGSGDRTVRVWDMEGNQLAVCRGHEGLVYSVYVKDSKIVSGSYDGTVRVWDMEGNQLAICGGHAYAVTSVCVTKDRKIVSGSWDKTVRVWNMEGNQLGLCRGHEGAVCSVCVTKDSRIVSGSEDKTLRVWDVQGNQLGVCKGHEDTVMSVCVTKDCKIVSGSLDRTVRVWDMEGNQLAECRGHQGIIKSVCVTQDGKIVSASHDTSVRIGGIGLLGRVLHMDEDQVRALWDYVRKLSGDLDKHTCWREIEKILGEDAPVAAHNTNNNNE